MEALIIVAHGSKLQSSNDEIRNIVFKIKESLQDDKLIVLSSFLELAEPSISFSAIEAINQGCKNIKFFPYFLAHFGHVVYHMYHFLISNFLLSAYSLKSSHHLPVSLNGPS